MSAYHRTFYRIMRLNVTIWHLKLEIEKFAFTVIVSVVIVMLPLSRFVKNIESLLNKGRSYKRNRTCKTINYEMNNQWFEWMTHLLIFVEVKKKTSDEWSHDDFRKTFFCYLIDERIEGAAGWMYRKNMIWFAMMWVRYNLLFWLLLMVDCLSESLYHAMYQLYDLGKII